MAPRTKAPFSPSRPRATSPVLVPEVVDPRWLLKAAGAVVAVGLLCAYLTVCGLFYNAQWQFVLHPTRTLPSTPAAVGLQFTPVRFGDDASGQPQLAGWWIPANDASDPTALMLHGAAGSMSEALPSAKALHDAGLNVLLFDYRGYGQSGGRHPTEALMEADARSALEYLTATRAMPSTSLVVYGTGLGASLATRLCRENPQLAGLILEAADGDTASRVAADQRSRILPLGLLFHERFPLADPLHALHTPKLLVSYTRAGAPIYAERAADPKITVELPAGANQQQLTAAVRRFLDTYVGHAPATLGAGQQP